METVEWHLVDWNGGMGWKCSPMSRLDSATLASVCSVCILSSIQWDSFPCYSTQAWLENSCHVHIRWRDIHRRTCWEDSFVLKVNWGTQNQDMDGRRGKWGNMSKSKPCTAMYTRSNLWTQGEAKVWFRRQMMHCVIWMDEISLMLKVLNDFFPSMGTHGEDEFRTLSTGLVKTNSTYIMFVAVQKT